MTTMNFYPGRTCKEYSLANALYDTIEDNNWRGAQYMLLEKHADPNVIILDTGISPFHLVIGNVSEEFAIKTTKLILQCGGNPNIQSEDGLTPLHIASAWGRMEIVELLLHFGADYEIRDVNYQTPIDYAVQHKYYDVARLLYDTYYTNINVENVNETRNCLLILEKIIVNDGVTEAEYEVEKCVSLPSSSVSRLNELPETTPSEYVRDWCNQHSKASMDLKHKNSETESNERIFVPFKCHHTKTVKPNNIDNVNTRIRKPNRNVLEMISLDYEDSDRFSSQKKREAEPNFFCKYKQTSRESGILSLSTLSSIDNSIILGNEIDKLSLKDVDGLKEPKEVIKDTSSDYFTCNEMSDNENVLEKNVFSIASNFSEATNEKLNDLDVGNFELNQDSSFFSVAEVYKYTDDKERIVLLEKRFLKTNSETDELVSQSSKLSSLPVSFDYDSDTLRMELTQYGFPVGPITHTTKRVYLKKLYKLNKQPKPRVEVLENPTKKVYSKELESTLQNLSAFKDVSYKDLEEALVNEFSNPDPTRKWREGVNKSSFSYLLLDPRHTKNLPKKAENMSLEDTWQTFLDSIFYVGKGKRTRPYSHLYEAVSVWQLGTLTSSNSKIQCILDIWKDNCGVVCLHVFQNVIPVEAYTREAAMINALTIQNVKNNKSGQFYGASLTWTSNQQKMLGALLLYKAMLIFLNEGERQLRPNDIN